MLRIFHPALMRIIFLGLGGLVYMQKKDLKESVSVIESILTTMTQKSLQMKPYNIAGLLLLILSIFYYYYGFSLAYIPFSTAWDANHAYMFYPKVWADSRGYNWNVPTTIPFIWYSYISIWFSLFAPLNLWVSADTIAVQMNFLSGIFVLLFGVTLMYQVVKFFGAYLKKNPSDDSIEHT